MHTHTTTHACTDTYTIGRRHLHGPRNSHFLDKLRGQHYFSEIICYIVVHSRMTADIFSSAYTNVIGCMYVTSGRCLPKSNITHFFLSCTFKPLNRLSNRIELLKLFIFSRLKFNIPEKYAAGETRAKIVRMLDEENILFT